jgi:hypothetical protein
MCKLPFKNLDENLKRVQHRINVEPVIYDLHN